VVPAAWGPSIEELTTDGVRGDVYAHEIVSLAPGQAGEYLNAVAHEGADVYAEYGFSVVGAFSTALRSDNEAILIWAIPLNLLRDVPLMALLSAEGERWVFRVTLVSAGLNLVLNIALIPPFGLMGAASATVITEAIRMLLAAWVARGMGFHLPGPRRFVKAGLATLAMAGCLCLLPNSPVWLSVVAGGLTYLVVLAGLGGIRLGQGRQPMLSV
jgi:hypothetical protein